MAKVGRQRALSLWIGSFAELFEDLWELPTADLSLQVELPKLLSPALNRLCDAGADDDPDPELLEAVVTAIDRPTDRARLARAVIARAKAEAIDDRLAAAALLDPGSDSRRLLRASLLERRRAGRRRPDPRRDPARRLRRYAASLR